MTKALVMILGALLFLPTGLTVALAQSTVPPPLRVFIPFEAAWRGMREVFREREWMMVEEDQARGVLKSSYVEYSSGTLTKSHISKIGKRPDSTDGDWIRVEYRYDILIALIEAKETIVTVDADIRALKRSFLGDETWIKIPSNGQRERHLLEEFGQLLFGQMFSLDKSRGGSWKLEPNYVPDMTTRAPVTNRDRP